MLDTTRELHPRKAQYNLALDWEYGPMGLILHGKTGTGKSRALYDLADWQISEGRSVKVIDGGDLRKAILNCIAPGGDGDIDELMADFRSHHLVGIDDFDKIKFSEGVCDEIFYLINKLTGDKTPIIYTMNSTGCELEKKMIGNGANDTEPLLRRMREFCGTIDFDPILPDPPGLD
jgi:DNA replication protein DnaC